MVGSTSVKLSERPRYIYYDLALKLGVDQISDFMHQFGFGEKTGIDIAEEIPAIMPNSGWKRARYGQPWYAGETLSVGIDKVIDRYTNATCGCNGCDGK